MVVVLVVVVVLVSLDGLALVRRGSRRRQIPHGVPAQGRAAGRRGLQGPAPRLALLGSVPVLPVPEGCQAGEEARAGGQVGGRGPRGDGGGGSRRGFASRPPGHMADAHVPALGLGGPHKVLAPVLGATEPQLGLRGRRAWVRAGGLPVGRMDSFRLVGARPRGVGGAGGQF